MTWNAANRRGFLRLVLGAAGGVAVAHSGLSASNLLSSDLRRGESTMSQLAALTGYRRYSAAIGLRYLEQAPEERDATVLMDRTLHVLKLKPDTVLDTGPGMRARIQQQVTQDFDSGAIVVVGGWMLARTEARLCAVTHLYTTSAQHLA